MGLQDTLSAGKGRWRWMWQCALLLAVHFFLSAFAEMSMPHVGLWLFGDREIGSMAADTITNLIICLLITYVFCCLQQATPAAMGLTPATGAWRPLLWGGLIGAALVFLLAAILYIGGDLQFTAFTLRWQALLAFLFFVSVGFAEEILARGALQHVISRSGFPVLAIFVPSFIFGLLHLGNESVSLLAVANTVLAGIILALFTYVAKNLYAAIGFHIAWNYVLGIVWGLPVSGNDFSHFSMAGSTLYRNTLWNGGSYGVEGGLYCTIVFAAVIAWQLMHLYKHKAFTLGKAQAPAVAPYQAKEAVDAKDTPAL